MFALPRSPVPTTALLAIGLGCGCAAIPRGRAAVNSVDVTGADQVSSSDVKDRLATTASPRFLGLFRGVVYDYQIFNRYVLERDLQRVERYYRARGFYKARARAGRIFYDDPKHVRVEILVEEGPLTTIRGIALRGIEHLPQQIQEEVRLELEARLVRGQAFEEAAFQETEVAIQRALADRGYAYAKVTRTAQVDVPRDFAMLAFDVEPDQAAVFGSIRIEGLDKIPEAPVRRAIDIAPGEPYSATALEDAEQAVLDLGVFSVVDIEPDLEQPRTTPRVVPLRVHVQPSKLKAVRLGAGLQLDTTRTDVHALAGWEHRNLFGGLRSFDVELRPGVVLYPTRLPELNAPTHFLPEEKLRLELRQPGFIEARTNGFIRGEFNVYPEIPPGDIDEERPVVGYAELRLAPGLDRNFGRHLYVSPSYNLQLNAPFAYVGTLDPDLRLLWISYPELRVNFDFRDDRISPHKGLFVGMDFQVAGVFGHVRDVKVQPEVRGYVPLASDLTLALRATTGLLLPQNYEEPRRSQDRAEWVRNSQIVFFRGFFSGGPNSNRGYASRDIGPHGPVPYYFPQADASAICDPESDDFDDESCNLPLGGFTLWETSAELRLDFSGPLSGALFCDASDVAPGTGEYRFERLHLSCGPGIRYETPLGPVRADIGYRIPGLQVVSGDTSGEGDPSDFFGVLPLAVSISIGEAF